jgi:tetratricopeptide (TPR) repeat protein
MIRVWTIALIASLAAPAAAEDAGPSAVDAGMSLEEILAEGADGGPGMTEVLEEAMKKIAATRSAEARRLLKKKNYPAALARYREAHDLDPANPEITNNLGYIYFLLGNYDEAERLYRWALKLDPERYVAHLNLADLLVARAASPERLTEAAELLERARELKGNKPKLILRQARVATSRGEFEEAERYYKEYLALRRPTDKLRLELGDFYRDLGRTDEALEWYRQIDEEDLGQKAAGRIWEIEVERQARKFGWTRRAGAIPAKARALATRGRVALNKRRYDEAERLLREALALAPGFAMARADLGDVLLATERPAEAELSYLRALAVDHSSAEIHARLGELYLAAPKEDGRSAEAALFLGRALDLRPDWTELHLKLAHALRAAGDLPSALRHVNRYLAGVVRDEDRKQALRLKRNLEALVPPDAREDGPFDESLTAMSEELVKALGAARAHLARGETDAAMAELRRLSDDERTTEVLNLEARILIAAGRRDEAIATLRASLRLDEKQDVAHGQLGAILIEAGDEKSARIHLERAEELGGAEATYHLARLDAGDDTGGILVLFDDVFRIEQLLAARDRLDRFIERGSASVFRGPAVSLRERVGERLMGLVIAAGAVVLLILIGVAALGVMMWGGSDLKALIEQHPEAGPEVQRVLSAVRHEVLKHNTMMLAGLVDAIERGDDASELAAHFRASLVGEGTEGGVAARLDGYVAELKRIGRANRKRLNLRRKDAAITPLLKGFELLERAKPVLKRLSGLSSGARAALLRNLKTASRLLNTEAYEAVRALLDRLRILEVDEDLLLSIYDRCCGEPTFVGVTLGRLQMSFDLDVRSGITVPRAAFEDVLANLIRNGIQSSLEHGESDQVVIGLGVELEVDPITGLERLVFLVRDRSPKVLTAEMLRGRYIEEGLGLTADLVSRYEGTLDVLPGADGWSKSVVVKLPRVDLGESEESEAG